MSELPDVVHVGFSKCASTFLRAFFGAHPQSFLISEAHFFVPFEHCQYDRGNEFYAELFSAAAPDQLRVESDEHIVLPLLHPELRAAATTLTAVEEASKRVKDTVPNAKIILIVRNQVDLILSRYGEYIMGGRNIGFASFVEQFLCSSTDQTNYYQNYYAKVVDILHRDFSPANVLVLLQEELFSNERAVITQLCEFLDMDASRISEDDPNAGPRFWSLDRFRVVARSGKHSKNTGLSLTGIRIMRLWNKLMVIEAEEAYFRKATSILPYVLYKFGVRAIRVIDYYLPKSLKGNKKALLTASIVERIRSEFDADNQRLGQLLGKDLAALGY